MSDVAQYLRQLGFGLLSGQNIGQAGMLAEQGLLQAKDRKAMEQQKALQQQLLQMQVEQAKKQQATQEQLGQAALQAFQPPEQIGATPFDDEGNAMMTRGGGGLPAFAQRAMQIDPLGMGMQLQSQMQKTQAPVKLGAGEVLFDPNTGRQIYQAPQKPEKQELSELGKLLAEQSKYQPNTTTFKSYQQRIDKLNKADQASGKWQYDADRGLRFNLQTGVAEPITMGGAPLPPKSGAAPKLTEDERRSAGLAVRMENAIQAMSRLPNATKPELLPAALSGMGMDIAANVATSKERQQVESAQLDALDAALTLATGAAYTKEQLKNLSKSYFPQIGDDPETVAAKQKTLADVIQTARIRAGGAAPTIDQITKPAGGFSIRKLP